MRKVKILNTIAVILLVFQLLSYLGNSSAENEVLRDPYERLGYYFGFNIALLIAIILFVKASSIKKKLKKKEMEDTIDSIGKPDKD